MLFLPSVPPETFRDIGLYFLIISFISKLILLVSPIFRTKKLFEGRTREACKQFDKLEIPGVRNFLFKETVLLTGPYPFAIAIFALVDWTSIGEIGLVPLLVVIFGLSAWAICDIFHSYKTQIFLHEVIDDIEDFDNKFSKILGKPTNLDLINKLILLVEVRTLLKDKAKRITKKMNKVVDLDLTPGLFGKILSQVDHFLDATGEVISNAHSILAEKMLEHFDKFFANQFKQYTNRPNWEVAFWISWALTPSIWLLLVMRTNQLF